MSAPQPATPATEKYTPLSPASLTGGRRHKLKKVSAKTIKRTLKRLGMKPKSRVVLRGGNADPELKDEEPMAATSAGRRRRGTKKTHRRGRSLFGMKY
jgi:hypothetical protein